MFRPSSSGLLWTHQDPTATRIWQFKAWVEETYHVNVPDYEALRQWSITNLDAFWSEIWDFTGVVASEPFVKVYIVQCHINGCPLIYAPGHQNRFDYVSSSIIF